MTAEEQKEDAGIMPPPEKEQDGAAKSDILPPSERDRRVTRAKRKLLQGRAMIDEALRELEGLEAA